MIVEFIGGPVDGITREIPDNIQAHNYEWRFPCKVIMDNKLVTQDHVYRREVGSDKFEYYNVQDY